MQRQSMWSAQLKNKLITRKMKAYADDRRGAKESIINIGDKVLFDQRNSKELWKKYMNRQENIQ